MALRPRGPAGDFRCTVRPGLPALCLVVLDRRAVAAAFRAKDRRATPAVNKRRTPDLRGTLLEDLPFYLKGFGEVSTKRKSNLDTREGLIIAAEVQECFGLILV